MLVGELDGEPRRVVSLNPSITEFLFVAGMGGRVIATDYWSYRPREAAKLPKVASFVDADLTAVEAARPDLVILYYPVQRRLIEPMSRIAPVLAVPTPPNVDAAAAYFKAVGRLLGCSDCDSVADAYRSLFREAVEPRSVMAVLWLGGPDLVGRLTFTADALERIGARYVGPLTGFKPASIEEAVKALARHDPEVVIYEAAGKQYSEREVSWIVNAGCTACRAGRIVVTPNDTLAHYGPSLPLDLAKVAEAVRRGSGYVAGVSSVVRPSLRDQFYAPFTRS